jgi:hypothetical protein
MQTALPMDPVGGESMTQDDSAMATQNPSATGLEFEVRHLIRELFYSIHKWLHIVFLRRRLLRKGSPR